MDHEQTYNHVRKRAIMARSFHCTAVTKLFRLFPFTVPQSNFSDRFLSLYRIHLTFQIVSFHCTAVSKLFRSLVCVHEIVAIYRHCTAVPKVFSSCLCDITQLNVMQFLIVGYDLNVYVWPFLFEVYVFSGHRSWTCEESVALSCHVCHEEDEGESTKALLSFSTTFNMTPRPSMFGVNGWTFRKKWQSHKASLAICSAKIFGVQGNRWRARYRPLGEQSQQII